mgnify:CR=1 FL=1
MGLNNVAVRSLDTLLSAWADAVEFFVRTHIRQVDAQPTTEGRRAVVNALFEARDGMTVAFDSSISSDMFDGYGDNWTMFLTRITCGGAPLLKSGELTGDGISVGVQFTEVQEVHDFVSGETTTKEVQRSQTIGFIPPDAFTEHDASGWLQATKALASEIRSVVGSQVERTTHEVDERVAQAAAEVW